MDRRELFGGKPRNAPRTASMGPDFYTNAELITQDGRKVRFYDDCIKDRLVVINYIYTNCQGLCPISTAQLVRVQKLLETRKGSPVSMYTLSLKPWEDGPEQLKGYAEGFGAKWTFLTGNDFDITTIRFRLGRWEHPDLDFDLEQHTGMVRTINDRIDRWSMCPVQAKPQQIIDAIDWVEETRPLEARRNAGYARRNELNAEQSEWFAREGVPS